MAVSTVYPAIFSVQLLEILILFQIAEAPLGLGSRDYYLGERNDSKLMAYQNYASEVAKLMMGSNNDATRVDDEMEAMLDFAIQVANVSLGYLTASGICDTYTTVYIWPGYQHQYLTLRNMFQLTTPPEQKRDYEARYNKMTIRELYTNVTNVSSVFIVQNILYFGVQFTLVG